MNLRQKTDQKPDNPKDNTNIMTKPVQGIY